MAAPPHLPATLAGSHGRITTMHDELEDFRSRGPGYYIEHYVPDPNIPQVYFHPGRNRMQLHLPPVPMPLRWYGVEGVIPIRISYVQNDGRQKNWKHSFIVPTGFPICVTTGAVSYSENTIAQHLTTRRDVPRVGNQRPRNGMTAATYEAIHIPQAHVDWANNAWGRQQGWIPHANRLPSVPVDGQQVALYQPPDPVCTTAPRAWMIRQLPHELMSLGIPGVFLARVIGTDRRLQWVLHVPPGFLITRWCGYTNNVWSTMASCHTNSCEACYLEQRNNTFDDIRWEPTHNMSYEFVRINPARINWANDVIARERMCRSSPVPIKYTVPPRPSLFFPPWGLFHRIMEMYMICRTMHGPRTQELLRSNEQRSLYIRPHEAMAANHMPDGAYLWSRVRPYPALPNGLYRYEYPLGIWFQRPQNWRRQWIRVHLTLPEFIQNGIDPPPFPHIPVGAGFPHIPAPYHQV